MFATAQNNMGKGVQPACFAPYSGRFANGVAHATIGRPIYFIGSTYGLMCLTFKGVLAMKTKAFISSVIVFFALCVPQFFAGAAHAQNVGWQAPEGCEIFLTVQAKGCRVSNHYRCEGDRAGDQWRADFDQEGMFFRSRINAETEWVESYDSNPPVQQLLGQRRDPASFSDLIAAGVDTFDFDLTRSDGVKSSVKGFDRLTGVQITIDGVILDETAFEATETDVTGAQMRASRGREYISRDKRLFFAGPGEVDLGDGQWLPIDGSPIDFINPGEPGFAAKMPLYDCDPVLTEAPRLPAIPNRVDALRQLASIH